MLEDVAYHAMGSVVTQRPTRECGVVTSEARQDTRTFRKAAQVAGFLTMVFFVTVYFRVGGSFFSTAVDDLGEMTAALVATLACAVASRRIPSARAGWALMALSSFAWACGEAVWSYHELIGGVELPYPSGADVGFLAAIPLAVVGLRALFPGEGGRYVSQRRRLIDGILLGSVAMVVMLAALLLNGPETDTLLGHVVGLAYPASDLVMVLVVLAAVRHDSGERKTMDLVLVGLVAFAVADTSFAVLTTTGGYGSGSWIDTGWFAGYLLIALGALWAIRCAAAPSQHRATSRYTPVGLGVAHSQETSAVGLLTRPMAVASTGGPWLTTTCARYVVSSTSILLIIVDTGVVLYDLVRILTLLA